MEEVKTYHGPLHSAVAGRTDHLPTTVDSGSYVIPADIISHYGAGNTTAGFKVFKRLFGGIPYSNDSHPYGEDGPYGDPIQNRASGGSTHGTVPCVLAGGEYVVHPFLVKAIGERDLATGHAVLDQLVLRARKELIEELKKLPPPKK